jgi:hypothetical protein
MQAVGPYWNSYHEELPNGKGLGTFIGEPTKWRGGALFDQEGRTKPEIDVYQKLAKTYGE